MRLTESAVVLLLVAGAAHAQVVSTRDPLADSSVSSILAHVRRHADAPIVSEVLREESGPQPRAKRDELADSLLARVLGATRPRTADSVAYDVPSRALVALSYAGNVAVERGHPYDGAFDRLVQVHRASRDTILRGEALTMLPGVDTTGRAEQYLRTVAASRDATAAVAVMVLITEANGGRWTGPMPTAARRDAAARVLRDLYAARAVTNRRGAEALSAWMAHLKRP